MQVDKGLMIPVSNFVFFRSFLLFMLNSVFLYFFTTAYTLLLVLLVQTICMRLPGVLGSCCTVAGALMVCKLETFICQKFLPLFFFVYTGKYICDQVVCLDEFVCPHFCSNRSHSLHRTTIRPTNRPPCPDNPL